jgi:tetratricopeptide (TPR) repeat protein
VSALGARRWTAASLLIFAAAIAACARARPTPAAQGPRPVATPRPAPPRPSGLLAAARAEAAWARRDDPAALEEAVRFFEQAAAHDQDPAPLLLRAARGHRLRADQLAAQSLAAPLDAEPGAAGGDLLAASARESALCAIDARRSWSSISPAAAAALEAGVAAAEALQAVSLAAAEPLYLDALCAADRTRAQGFTHLVERHGELRAALERARALEPALDDAGPDRELGKLLAQLPASAGGDLREARARFEAALARAPDSIATRLLFASSVAVKQQDRALFESLLQAAQALPAATPEDRAAQAAARVLLAREDDLFIARAR